MINSAMGQKLGIPPATWENLYREFVEGKGTIASLAVKYGLRQRTIENRARAARWGRERRLFQERATTPQHAVDPLPMAILPDSTVTASCAFAGYQHRLIDLDEIASLLTEDIRDASSPNERAQACYALDRVLERMRIMLRIPTVAPMKPMNKPPGRSLDIEPIRAPADFNHSSVNSPADGGCE